uniref:Uncharacterized protein n=1 Tax=Timema shepardi TaxID=629360 RepID=A0A7R9ARB0_TIMSH|nr:unnamed protein product [Timema shepardi]
MATGGCSTCITQVPIKFPIDMNNQSDIIKLSQRPVVPAPSCPGAQLAAPSWLRPDGGAQLSGFAYIRCVRWKNPFHLER